MRLTYTLGLAALFTVAASAPDQAPRIEAVADAPALVPVDLHIVGRTLRTEDGYARQWPGTYFEGTVTGSTAWLKVGAGEVGLRIRIDDGEPIALVRPAPGTYRLSGLTDAAHRIRVDVASESQAGPTVFGGLYADKRTPAPAPAPRARQIEFIGDSHTVGYGNTSSTRDCSQQQVWEATDTSRGLAPLTAAKYHADYQVNAISGRGIVRNYNGGPGDTLPQAYPYTLFDRRDGARDPDWHPQLIVIALGTNDFSTPLRPEEPWKTRDELHAAYEAGYVAFLKRLRATYSDSYFLLWSTELYDREIATEVAKVVEKSGDRRLAAVTISGLAMTGCHFHPNLADDAKIAGVLTQAIDARRSRIW